VPLGVGQIILANCSHITVDKQTMVNGTVSILAAYINNCTFSNNRCTGNIYGIYLISSNNNKLTGNNCHILNQYGIVMDDSDINMLMNNNCSGNSGSGINLVHSDTNTITNNILQENTKYGVHIQFSTNNHIHHNNFINNNAGWKQAKDDNVNNFWNASYPSGGNYWSEWTSPDVKSGPNQNSSGSDGIVDSPYLIDLGIGVKDYYPLTTHVKIPEPSPAPLVIISVLLITALVARGRRLR
jgi:parallel beta-helix repeat protein